MEVGRGMDKIQSTLLNNRVKIMKLCDYFAVSAPMIARRILPLERHRAIKLSAGSITTDGRLANNARMDALLDFVDEFATPQVFDSFLEGLKNCETSKGFAKILKKEAEGGSGESSTLKLPKMKVLKPKSPKPKPKLSSGPAFSSLQNGPPALSSAPETGFGFGVQWIPATGNDPRPLVITPASTPTGATKKPKAPRPKKTPVPNGPAPNSAPGANANTTPKGRTPKASKKTTPKLDSSLGLAVQPAAGSGAPATKKTKKAAVGKNLGPGAAAAAAIAGIPRPSPRAKPESKVITPGPSLTATLVYKDDAGAGPSVSKKGFNTKVPAGSPFRAKNGMAKSNQKANKMTFQEAVEKQKSAVRAIGFSFINQAAFVKSINFNNKSDLFYEGCPTKEGAVLCTKKVQLKGKGKKYVCKDKHENESYELFPRLDVTFEDATAQIQATLYRENVEILAGKPVSELHRIDDTSLSAEFAKAYGQNIPIRVSCEKVHKKDLKKSGGATWNNVAVIIAPANEGSGGPAAKKPRKSSAD